MRKSVATVLCVLVCHTLGCVGEESGPPDPLVVHVGLAANVPVPPKGFGVAPILGYPGPVPASAPAASVGANGPGSLSLYGGQWIVPLPVQPGAKIANASCDFISNNSTIATVELVGRSGTITSKTFGPAAGVNLTLWLLPTDADPSGYTVGDGEHVAIRASFRDSVTGAWTTGAQQVPMLSCAVSANKLSPLPSGTTYNTIPSNLFSAPDIRVGINGQVYAVPMTFGLFTGATVTGQCASAGFIIACARIRERGTWDWCSLPIACSGAASAVVPLTTPIRLDTGVHVDVALMSGPSVASSPFGVYTSVVVN